MLPSRSSLLISSPSLHLSFLSHHPLLFLFFFVRRAKMIFHLLSSVCPEHVSLASVSQHLGINQLFFSTFFAPLACCCERHAHRTAGVGSTRASSRSKFASRRRFPILNAEYFYCTPRNFLAHSPTLFLSNFPFFSSPSSHAPHQSSVFFSSFVPFLLIPSFFFSLSPGLQLTIGMCARRQTTALSPLS